MSLLTVFNAGKTIIIKHRRTILTGIEIGSACYGVYRAYKDGPKFKKILDELNEKNADFKTKFKTLAPIVAPTAASIVVNATAAITNQVTATKEISRLSSDLSQVTSALAISQSVKAMTEQKARELLGDDAVDKVNRAVAVDHATSVYDNGSFGGKMIVTGHGNDLFFDDWSGRYFLSDINYVKKVVNDLNRQLMDEMSVCVNEFYVDLKLPAISAGTHIGWNIDYGLLEIDYYPELDDNDRPYTVIRFRNEPKSLIERRNW